MGIRPVEPADVVHDGGGVRRNVRGRALRVYALAYAALALSEDGVPEGDPLRHAVRALFLPTTRDKGTETIVKDVPLGEPESSSGVRGYSPSRDVLWVRPHLFFRDDESRDDGSNLDSPRRLLEDDRYLWPRLRAFVGSEVWRAWRQRDVRPCAKRANAFFAGDRAACRALMHAHGMARVPYRGVLLVGHDPETLPGLFVIGVRRHEWLVNESARERLRWLLLPPNFAAPLPLGEATEDVSAGLVEEPSMGAFADRPFDLVAITRALVRWHTNPTPDPWYWRSRRTGHPSPAERHHVWLEGERVPLLVMDHSASKESSARWLRDALNEMVMWRSTLWAERVVVAAWLPMDSITPVIGRVLVLDPAALGRRRFLVVDQAMIDALARRYPWVWSLEATAILGASKHIHALVGNIPLARDLAALGRTFAALVTLRAALAVPRPNPSPRERAEAGRLLLHLEKDDPWMLLRDVARLHRPILRHEPGGSPEAEKEYRRWWTEQLPQALLASTTAAVWALTPERYSPEWCALVRLLWWWRTGGAEDVALRFAEGLRSKLFAVGARTAIVDAAWDEASKVGRG